MSSPSRSSVVSSLGVGLLLALVILLGVLQYRWAGELSRAERQRLDRGLAEAVERFAGEFDRELSRAFLHFSVAPGGSSEAAYLRLLEGWQETAPYPEMIRDLVVWEPGAPDGVRIAALGADTFRSGELDEGLEQLARGPRGMPERGAEWRQVPHPEGLAPEVPALLPPVVSLGGPETRPFPRGRRPAPPMGEPRRGRLAVRLDLDYLRSELFPLLAERYLGVGGSDDAVRYAILSDVEGGRVVFESEPGFAESGLETIDAESRMFRILPPERLGSLPREVILSRIAGSRPPDPAWRGEMERGWGGWRGMPGFAGARMAQGHGAWRLVVQHREGSLANAVERNRRRNLGVSAIVLLLLAGVVVLLVVSSRRAQELAARKVEFVAGVSHELRTPLASIRSLGQNLADGIVEHGNAVRRYGELIEAESTRLTRMIEQVLAYSRGLSGERLVESEPVSIEEVIGATARRCAPQLEEAGVELALAIGADLPRICGDGAALGGALENLIANAIKFGGGGGWVGVTADSPDGSSIRIRVADRGPGIEPRDRARLFEPFFRGRRARESQAPGSGLGLSLVREMVEAHGGTVEAGTAEGGGALFTIVLPGSGDVA